MRKVLAGTLLVVALAFALAGCGGSSSTSSTQRNDNGEAAKSANQVLADAVAATKSASFVHVTGNATCGGKPDTMDSQISKGEGLQGTLTIEGQPVGLMVIGKDAYVKAYAAFWEQFGGSKGAAAAQTLNEKWVKFPLNNAQFQAFVSCMSPKAIFDKFKADAGSGLKNNGVTTYNGQSAIELDGGAENGTLYVAASGNPYPVALVKKGSGGATISFGGWNNPVTLVVPAPVVDISQLPA
jgi:hypothetical protein